MAQILPGFIVGLREGLEAFLIITLILEYLNKLGKRELFSSVRRGMYAGLAFSLIFGLVLWLLASALDNNSAAAGKLWEAIASFTAVLFISYFIYWMIRNGKNLVGDIKNSVDKNLSSRGLFLLSTVAVAREGAEISLFAFTAENKAVYLTGNLSGVLVAGIIAFLVYKSLVKIDIALIFRITLFYLILQSAYLFGYAVHELLSALKAIGTLGAESAVYTQLYNLGGTVLDHKTGALGIPLNVLAGWYSKPEIIQAVLQSGYAILFGVLWFTFNRREKVEKHP